MFPLRDHIRPGSPPLMTLFIILICVLVWVFVQGMGQELVLAKSLEVPALLFLGYWFLIQLFSGALSLDTAGSGIAFWAHVGSFLVGWLMALPLCRRGYTPDFREPL